MNNNNHQGPVNPNPKTKKENEEEEEIGRQAIGLAFTVVLPMVLRSAIDLGLIDTIYAAAGDNKFISPSEILHRLPCGTSNPLAHVWVDRVLRLLASHSILTCCTRENGTGEAERLYGAAPICRFLVKNGNSGSVGPLLSMIHGNCVQSWYHLSDAIREGGNPFNRAYGKTIFEHLGTDQTFNRLFNQAMSEYTILIVSKAVEVYAGFKDLNLLIDVGGGTGITLSIITAKYPNVKGVNFDLPHVLADAPSYPGVEHVEGDMFKSVPKGDAILLKWILHDWTDEDCLKILNNCWEAVPSHGKVVVIESILPEEPASDITSKIVAQQDLGMLVQCPGGKERTRNEFEALAVSSGFSGCRVICSAYNCWVMEFCKSSDA